eukprot:788227-Prymnesium_polylepis.1
MRICRCSALLASVHLAALAAPVDVVHHIPARVLACGRGVFDDRCVLPHRVLVDQSKRLRRWRTTTAQAQSEQHGRDGGQGEDGDDHERHKDRSIHCARPLR